jgi:type I restriction enzyme M protein
MDRKELATKIEQIYEIMRADGLTLVDYVEQLSWLLFLKAFEKLEEDRKLEAEFEEKEYKPTLDPKFNWSSWAKKDMRADQLKLFIETELFPYLQKLTGSREKNLIATIFSEVKQKMRDPNNLKQIILMIDSIDFNNPEDSHILSQVYEETLMMMGREGGAAGEYYTPRPIVRLMTKIVRPKIGETIFDPFCGSGGFLVEAYNLLKEQKKLSTEEWEKLQSETFFGQELKAIPSLVCTMNCILHGLQYPNIVRRDTFEENVVATPQERYDVILTNPPFGGKISKHLQMNLPVKTSSTELGALEFCMRKLNKGGRCGIVLPEGVLFRGGAYKKVKKQLLEDFNVHTIISLPAGVFAHVAPKGGQGPKTNLVFFDKSGPTTEIWYYELSHPERGKFSKANPILDEDLKDCFEKWKDRKKSENSWIVTIDEIKERDYDLSARNPHKKEEIELKPPEELVNSILEREKQIAEILKDIQKAVSDKGS